MKIIINGEVREVPEDVTISKLLDFLGFQPEGVVVEKNGEIIDRENFSITTLSESDRIELVRFVGGG